MSKSTLLLAVLIIAAAGFIILRYNTANPGQEKAAQTPPKAATDTVGNLHQWREFSSDTGKFKVLLPTLPQHVTDMLADPKTREQRKYETFVAAGDNGAAFMISAISSPNSLNSEDNDETLKSAVSDMMARNKENKLNKMEMGKFREQRAVDFSLTNGDLLIVGKVFSHNNILYILSMINKSSSFNPQELDFFINSFHFSDNGSTPQNGKK